MIAISSLSSDKMNLDSNSVSKKDFIIKSSYKKVKQVIFLESDSVSNILKTSLPSIAKLYICPLTIS